MARNADQYGALIAFTGGLIGLPGTSFKYPGDLSGAPCFLGSGDPDPHVPWERVEESASVFSSLGGIVTLRRYPGLPHTINQDEIEQAKHRFFEGPFLVFSVSDRREPGMTAAFGSK